MYKIGGDFWWISFQFSGPLCNPDATCQQLLYLLDCSYTTAVPDIFRTWCSISRFFALGIVTATRAFLVQQLGPSSHQRDWGRRGRKGLPQKSTMYIEWCDWKEKYLSVNIFLKKSAWTVWTDGPFKMVWRVHLNVNNLSVNRLSQCEQSYSMLKTFFI